MDFDLSSDQSANAEDLLLSPDIMTTDLGLDPSDPLNLLLHNSAQGTDSVEPSKSVVDWSQLAMLWPSSNDHHYLGDGVKCPDIAMDYNLSLPISLDYHSSMAVDPSALHFESAYHTPSLFTSSLPVPSDFLPSSFPFTFRSDESSSSSSNSECRVRRLSVTSSSSSSGASFSPVIESKTPKIQNPADELAQRVRQSAGVLLAVPTGVHGQAPQRPLQNSSKLPVARLNRPRVTTKVKRHPQSESSSTASSPPPSDAHTSSPVSTSQPEPSSAIPSPPTTGRPKTSHTTIERRYRTNLNARIQSLKQAVPALRVLEDKGRPRKDGEPVDVVDERGFVDGVKVARKCSKANVLGKAVEYIRVLKRRERRLIREQNGLKSLISGLVGGPALLKEWETEWRAKFGGEETDEIEMEPVSEDDEGDDDEDGDDYSKEDEDEGRAKKKVKVAKVLKKAKKFVSPPVTVPALLTATSPDTSFGNALPEKRKRGRPRKIPSSIPIMGSEVVYTTNVLTSEILVSATDPVESVASESVAANQGQASHYLLATFALFSFFNSPLTQTMPRTSSQAHTGVVLGHIHTQQPLAVPTSTGYTWQNIIQAFHLLVSILVFCSILAPWLPTTISRNKYVLWLSPISWLLITNPTKPNTSSIAPSANLDSKADEVGREDLMDALDDSRRGTPNEANRIRSALNVTTGLSGFMPGMFGKRIGKDLGFEHKGLVQRAWVRLGELAVLDCSTSLVYNLYTYWHMRSHVSWFSASPSDLSTLAILIYPFSGLKAASYWNRAKSAQLLRSHEKLVLESLTVDEAVARLKSWSGTNHELDKYSPIGVLAYMVIRERIKQQAASLFVRTIVQDQSCDWHDTDSDVEHVEEERVIIDAAKSLGGRTRALAEMLERVWKMDVGSLEDVERAFEIDGEDVTEGGITSLLKAVALYKRIFPTYPISRPNGGTNGICILLSPPPSPSRKNSKVHLALRRVLGSSVFDCSDFTITTDNGCHRAEISLDEARDRVVDMLMDLELQMRGSLKKGDALY